jgi:pimeloyl-ACP methyl ester carboxylesterase
MLLYPSTSLEQCTESGIHEANLFVFAYDWRKSNDDNAELLRDYIECVREQTDSEYVDVVAHSMGGVLTRRYVLENQNNHHIDRFISVATPWLGAPMAVSIVEMGVYPGIGDWNVNLAQREMPIILPPQLRPVAAMSSGAHELLPSAMYFDRSDEVFGYEHSVFREGGWDYNQEGGNYQQYTYEDLMNALDKRFDSNPGTINSTFHTAEQDNLTEWYGVDHYNFYGQVNTYDTVVQIGAIYDRRCTDWFGDVFTTCSREMEYFTLRQYLGDGTVPVISAVPPPLEEPEHCDGYQGGHIACFSGPKEEADHGALVRNDKVLGAIVDILARRAPVPPVAAGPAMSDDTALAYSASFSALEQQADATAAQPAHYITILNTSSATLADALGNTTDAISGTLSTPVPNASYYILGEQAHMFVMPASETYTVTLPVGEAPMYMELRTGTGDTSTQTIRYSDQTFPLSTTAMLNISPQGVEDLRYDSDGDGTFDTSVEPTVSVSGDNANDTEPPTVSITVDEQDGQWLATITAEDNESGVKQVLYSTDDQRYMVYEEPFEVNPDEVTTLYAFADDNVANRSGVAVYEWERSPNQPGIALLIIGLTMLVLFLLALPGLVFALDRHQQRARTRRRPR